MKHTKKQQKPTKPTKKPTKNVAAFPVPPPPPPPAPTGRAGVDWVAAGKKAWETRAARAGGQPSQKPAARATPTNGSTAKLVVRKDATSERYEARVLAAIERTMHDDRREGLCLQMRGKDGGGGWVILATDGNRALTHRAASEDKTARPITTAQPLPFGFVLTPEVESALRTVARQKGATSLYLAIDAKAKTLAVRAPGTDAPVTVALTPSTVGVATLKAITLRVDTRLLTDALGRGGRFGYDGKPKSPVTIDTDDRLRYVLMPMSDPDRPKAGTVWTPPATTEPTPEAAS